MIKEILGDKSLKAKERNEKLASLLLEEKISADEILKYTSGLKKDADKATCIEAVEYATQQKPGLATAKTLDFVSQTLTEKAPRIKWESARVIGNIAHLFPSKMEKPVANLLENTAHPGTVVRWSAAFALSRIYLMKTKYNADLEKVFRSVIESDEKNSIKKIYITALKKK
ncbi:MAG: hypothetical protein A2W91_01365 [Bacteroidetes bacterium GWF2_38_335]|nr:MAG: hypothetical protein A2W91_01365 [Bacteroidetes bacterium GWF2_38_335]OFY80985.1 MAG: hypothetical protein A2281_12900 [Bacteroidetes bacterium RIFOXYA12_FULL_38_20]HBS85112.1 hypothetical protein [Bacteroidales bacterium]